MIRVKKNCLRLKSSVKLKLVVTMRKIVYVLFSIAITIIIIRQILQAFTSQVNESPVGWQKVLVLGDSNTEQGFTSWLNLLAHRLQRKCDVINRGFSGYTTRDIRLILPKLMDEFKSYIDYISAVVILLGTNDSASNDHHVDLSEFSVNYQWVIDYLQTVGVDRDRIIMLTPQKIIDHKWRLHVKNMSEEFEPNHKDHLVKPYSMKTKEIARKNGITFVDLYGIMQASNKNIDDYFYDGLHYSASGGQFLVDTLWPVVQQKLMDTNSLTEHYPDFTNFQYTSKNENKPQLKFQMLEKRSDWKKIVALGDSNTQKGFDNWLSLLSDKLKRKCDVFNRGFNGYTTRTIRQILPDIVNEFLSRSMTISAIIILLGTNDSSSNRIQHVPLDEFADNYQWIIDYLVNIGIEKTNIVMMTPPKLQNMLYSGAYTEKSLKQYASKVKEIAIRNQMLCFDLLGLIESSPIDFNQYLSDGLHFSKLGGEFLVENLWPFLNQTFVVKQKWRDNFPRWKDIDYTKNGIDSLPQ
jgi:lysophospholipase L1-like esterase